METRPWHAADSASFVSHTVPQPVFAPLAAAELRELSRVKGSFPRATAHPAHAALCWVLPTHTTLGYSHRMEVPVAQALHILLEHLSCDCTTRHRPGSKPLPSYSTCPESRLDTLNSQEEQDRSCQRTREEEVLLGLAAKG